MSNKIRKIQKEMNEVNKIRRYKIFMKRGVVNREEHVSGLILGLIFGLCSIPCETTMYDCEVYGNYIWFTVDCTSEKLEKLKSTIESAYGSKLCEFVEDEGGK